MIAAFISGMFLIYENEDSILEIKFESTTFLASFIIFSKVRAFEIPWPTITGFFIPRMADPP